MEEKNIERKMDKKYKNKKELNSQLKDDDQGKNVGQIQCQNPATTHWVKGLIKRKSGQCGTRHMERSEAQWKLISSYKASMENKRKVNTQKYIKNEKKCSSA